MSMIAGRRAVKSRGGLSSERGVCYSSGMGEPVRDNQLDHEFEEEHVPWTTLEIVQMNQFLVPAGFGVAVVVLLLLTDSAYAWVATFGYLMLAVPGLIIYLKGRARAPVDRSWRFEPAESEAERAVADKLKSFLGAKFPHTDEVERALAQYDQALAHYKALLLRVRSKIDPELAEGQKNLGAILSRLRSCGNCCTQLASIDYPYLIKRMQALNTKSQPNDYDQAELQSLQAKINAREQILSDLIDALRANDRALADFARLAPRPKSVSGQ